MAHFVKLDSDNIVIDVLVVNNDILLNSDNTESEQKGKDFLNTLFGSATWVQTSFNGNIRKNFAGIGYKYDSTRDAFIPPKPFNSWILNETTCLWEAPVPYPSDNELYEWNEEDQQWDLIN